MGKGWKEPEPEPESVEAAPAFPPIDLPKMSKQIRFTAETIRKLSEAFKMPPELISPPPPQPVDWGPQDEVREQ